MSNIYEKNDIINLKITILYKKVMKYIFNINPENNLKLYKN